MAIKFVVSKYADMRVRAIVMSVMAIGDQKLGRMILGAVDLVQVRDALCKIETCPHE